MGSARDWKWYILVQQNTSFPPQSRTEGMKLQTRFCFDSTLLACIEFVYFIPPFWDYCQNFKIRFLTLILIQISMFQEEKLLYLATPDKGLTRQQWAVPGSPLVCVQGACVPILPQTPLLPVASLTLMLSGLCSLHLC